MIATRVNVPCAQCGRDRWVYPCRADYTRARVCKHCGYIPRAKERRTKTARERVPVACPNCGQVRVLDKSDATRATRTERLCAPCGLAAQTEAQAYVDEMAVERLLMGMPVHSTRAERQAAVAALTARQKTSAEIAERLRVSPRTVQRLRTRELVGA